MTKVLIATPAMGRQVTIDYMISVRALEVSFRREGIESEILFTMGSSLPRSRAALASRFLYDQSFTHLLFVDNDMGFRPQTIAKMMIAAKDFCGCVYPARQLSYAKLHASARDTADPVMARNIGQNYVCIDDLIVRESAGQKHLVAHAGLFRTNRIGFGLTLIRRPVLTAMRSAFPSLLLEAGKDPAYRAMGVPHEVLQVFESVQLESGLFVGEDFSFCHRWTEGCGGEIWACIDEEITHVGSEGFVGSAIDLVRARGISVPSSTVA